MGIFDFLTVKKPKDTEADLLKKELLEALNKDNRTQFESLCHQYQDDIIHSFDDWKVAPSELKDDPEKLNIYVNNIILMASYFERELKRPELMKKLTGTEGENPILRSREAIQEARNLMQAGDYEGATEILEPIVGQVEGLAGTGADTYLALSVGALAESYFQRGKLEEAEKHMRKSLELVRNVHDRNGEIAYLCNLYEIARYAGDTPKAYAIAEEIVLMLQDTFQDQNAERWQKQAESVKQGEPLVRVMVSINGQVYPPETAPRPENAQMELAFVRNRIALAASQHKCKEGIENAGKSLLTESIDCFKQASELDPFNPDPPYYLAFACMHLQKYDEAIAAYERTESLAPGWYAVRADLHLARQIKAGEIGHEVFLTLTQLEDPNTPLDTHISVCQSMISKFPKCSEFYQRLGQYLQYAGRKDEAEKILREGLALSDNDDVKTRILRDLALVVESPKEKNELLLQAIELNGNLLAAAMCKLIVSEDAV